MISDVSKLEMSPVVRSAAMFRGVTKANIQRMLKRASSGVYPPLRWLYTQGQQGSKFFLLESGLVSLSELAPSGEETLIRFIIPGEMFGYVALADIDENVLSAKALSSSRVIFWDRATAILLLKECPTAAINILSTMVRDVAYYYHHARRFKTAPLERRVEWGLVELLRAIGKRTTHGIVIEHARQQQLAELAGTTVYSVSRELSKLEQRRVLRKHRGRIVVLQPEKLM